MHKMNINSNSLKLQDNWFSVISRRLRMKTSADLGITNRRYIYNFSKHLVRHSSKLKLVSFRSNSWTVVEDQTKNSFHL